MNFAEELINFRAKNNLSQKKAAEILGVGITIIHRYEHNISKPSRKNEIRFKQIMSNYNK